MAFGNENRWQQVFYLNMFTKKDEDPCFKVQTKQGKEYVDLPPATYVDGFLYGVEIKLEESFDKKRMEPKCYVRLFEGQQLYIVKMSFFMTGRSVMNSLASLLEEGDLSGRVKISMYQKKNDRGEYVPRAQVTYGPERLDWLLTPDEVKSLTKVVRVNNQDLVDSSALDARLTELMNQLKAHIMKVGLKPDSTSSVQHEEPSSFAYSDPGELDDKPVQMEVKVDFPKNDTGELNLEDPEDDLPF